MEAPAPNGSDQADLQKLLSEGIDEVKACVSEGLGRCALQIQQAQGPADASPAVQRAPPPLRIVPGDGPPTPKGPLPPPLRIEPAASPGAGSQPMRMNFAPPERAEGAEGSQGAPAAPDASASRSAPADPRGTSPTAREVAKSPGAAASAADPISPQGSGSLLDFDALEEADPAPAAAGAAASGPGVQAGASGARAEAVAPKAAAAEAAKAEMEVGTGAGVAPPS